MPSCHRCEQDARIQELQAELKAAAGSQRSVTASNTSVFAGASTVQSSLENPSTWTPPTLASASKSSSPPGIGYLQNTASSQLHAAVPFHHSSSGDDAKANLVQNDFPSAGRATIPPDQDYHPTYQLQQFRRPAQSQGQPAEDFDLHNSTLLQNQIAGVTSPLSGQMYYQPSSTDHIHSGVFVLPGQSASGSLLRSSSLQEQLADVQKRLQILSAVPEAQSYAQQFSQPHVQFNTDDQWGTSSANVEMQENLQFFA
jgi:hypothetical protein